MILADRGRHRQVDDLQEQVIDELVEDVSEGLATEDLSKLNLTKSASVAFHSIKDEHLCCGSAGTYSIFNAEILNGLLRRKLNGLEESNSDIIITAKVGCQAHLAAGTDKPVKHWIEPVDKLLR